jgi:hypothetical protein
MGPPPTVTASGRPLVPPVPAQERPPAAEPPGQADDRQSRSGRGDRNSRWGRRREPDEREHHDPYEREQIEPHDSYGREHVEPFGRDLSERDDRRGRFGPTDRTAPERPRRRQHDEPIYSVEDTDIVSPGTLALRPARLPATIDDELDDEGRPIREWLMTIVQLVAGAVAGAALWLMFQWLWRSQPMIAAVAGVLVTVVAVLLVRRIWRSSDLRSTVMTLLIGLFVTMSPAVLLLNL